MIADREGARPIRRSVHLADGHRSTAQAVAAVIELWMERDHPAPGIHAAGALFDADDLIARMRRLGGPDAVLDSGYIV